MHDETISYSWYSTTAKCNIEKELYIIRYDIINNGVSKSSYLFLRRCTITATYIINRIPSKSVSSTPYKLWTSNKRELAHLRNNDLQVMSL